MRVWTARHRVAAMMIALVVLAGLTVVAVAAWPGQRATNRATIPAPPRTTGAAAPSQQPAATLIASQVCRAKPLANVYRPQRLRVVDACTTVTGVVRFVRHEADGDLHINVTVDPEFASLVNASNRAQQRGDLVIEIVPADAPGCVAGEPLARRGSYDVGVCTGAFVVAPPVGARVRVTGAHVIDTLHGWAELHPVWAIDVLDAPEPSPATRMRIVSIRPDPLRPGARATLTASTSPGALCVITVRYPSGRVSTARDLVQRAAGPDGEMSWTWNVGTTTKPGIGTASVTCGGLTDQASFTVA
jgi:hypothetical protein